MTYTTVFPHPVGYLEGAVARSVDPDESEAMVIETRQILEELQLKEVLATSATGAVFLAGDPASGRDVVIKLVSCSVPGRGSAPGSSGGCWHRPE